MDVNQVKADAEKHMQATVEDARRKYSHIRTGRASVHLLDDLVVEYYGTPTPLNQVASVSAPEPALLTVQPWDASALKAIEKAIQSSDLNLNPSNDGKMIRIPIPPLTEDRRKQLAKKVRELGEEARTAIRMVRRDANEELKKLEKDGKLSQDDARRATEDVQKKTDKHSGEIDGLVKTKEKEIMEV